MHPALMTPIRRLGLTAALALAATGCSDVLNVSNPGALKEEREASGDLGLDDTLNWAEVRAAVEAAKLLGVSLEGAVG